MNRTPETFSGTQALGSLFRTERDAAVASLYEYVTAGGLNKPAEAIGFLAEGRDANLDELAREGGTIHDLVVEDWDSVAATVLELLQADIDE